MYLYQFFSEKGFYRESHFFQLKHCIFNGKATDFMVTPLDLKIIDVLKQDSRMSYTAIGNKVHLSPSSVRERVQKLVDIGVINGYSLKLDHSKLGYGLQVFIMLKLHSGKLKVFISDVGKFNEISEAYRVTGSYNIHMKVILKDQLHLQRFIDKLIHYGEPTTHSILSELDD